MFRFSGLFQFWSGGFHQYSTAAIAISGNRKPNNFIVDYLMNSFLFSKQDAISIFSRGKFPHPTANYELVVNTFKIYGLNNTQIKDIIFYAPKILTCKPHKTLHPKLRVFQELGLSGSDLVSLVKYNPEIFRCGLHTQIIPVLDLLKKLGGGSDENLIQVVKNFRWMYTAKSWIKRLSTNASMLENLGLLNESKYIHFVLFNTDKLTRISENVTLLRRYGVSDVKISKLLVQHTKYMQKEPEVFEKKLEYVEHNLGISRHEPMFVHGLLVVMYRGDSEIEKKKEVFRSFGWSDYEIASLIRSQPYCFTKSEDTIKDKLNVFMKELGYTPSFLMGRSCFMTLSLEKRVKPRYEIYKILKEKELLHEPVLLITLLQYAEPQFLGFLKSFENHVPNLCETYMNRVKTK
uniref:transcription termination factor MTEF18, mitochondrial-like n=1 Tax=Erigeron canadensis TaxID=72917 RepID=UPI001CB89A4A|nr:transcription termination factor MTEF18, mitochondrial-like [Erigeron canadensis]